MNYLDLEPDPLGFRGYGEYAIKDIGGNWTWYDSVAGVVMATYAPDKKDLNYPVGRKTWILEVKLAENKHE